MRNTLSRPRTEKRKRQTQKERWIQEKEQTKGEKRQAPSEGGGGGAAGPEQEEPVVKSGACCHVLTCPSVVILGELRLFVDHHASDGHVRVLLFGLLYSLGQCLSPPTVNQHKQTKANKRFKGKNEQLNKNENTSNWTQTDDGKHTCMWTSDAGICVNSSQSERMANVTSLW